MSLPRRLRLRRSRQFGMVRAAGTAKSGRLMTVAVHQPEPHPKHGPPALQFGFTVNKRVGNAVVRGKLKRQLRHIAREAAPQIQAGGKWIVTIPKPSITAANYTEIRGEWLYLANKLNVLERKIAKD